MAQENPVLEVSMVAGADLSADTQASSSKRYRAVKLNGTTAGSIVAIASTADVMLGVLKNLPASAEFAEVQVLGTCKVRAGAAFNANARLKLDSSGRFVTGGGGSDRNWAIALEAATAIGDVVEALLTGLVVT